MITFSDTREMLGYELLSSHPNISHFVTTRHGGYSKGKYASFNCTPYTGDDRSDVIKNQQILTIKLNISIEQLIIPRQTHSTNILVIEKTFSTLTPLQKEELLYGVDALITTEENICLCISTADCVPLLLYDPVHKVVAAIHAGWRGTVGGIVVKTIQQMKKKYNSLPADIIACIGPSISEKYFEVGNEVWEQFHQAGFEMETMSGLNQESSKWHINLWEANKQQLIKTGVITGNIEMAGICSYRDHADFFSARRAGIHSGRTLSGIMLHTFNQTK